MLTYEFFLIKKSEKIGCSENQHSNDKVLEKTTLNPAVGCTSMSLTQMWICSSD